MKRFSLSLIITLLCSFSAVAQETNTSPFSRYGLGQIQSAGMVHHLGMGGLTLPIAQFNRLTIDNPGTYGLIRRPAFDAGFRLSQITLDDGTNQQETTFGNFRHFALGVPIGKKWGGVFGLMPYSSVGYDITSSVTDENLGEIKYEYIGSGGINRVFLGTGYTVIDRDSTKLGIGVNASFLFGSIDQTRNSVFESGSGAFNTRVENSLIVQDFMYDFGLYYSGYVDKKTGIQMHTGATFNVPVSLKSKKDYLATSYLVQGGLEFVQDTIQMIDSISGTVLMPQRMGYGVAFEYKYQWLIGAQYERQLWGNYEERFNDTVTNQFNDSETFRIGVRYRPKLNLSPSAKVWNRAVYRAGFRTTNRFVTLGENDLITRAFSLGLGLPMARNFSQVNFGIEFGTTGSVELNNLKENFVNVYVGFSLSPQRRWFVKPKYD